VTGQLTKMTDELLNQPPNRVPFRERVRRAWQRLRGGELTPARAFWSVFFGLFVGVLPTPGLHLPVVLAVGVPLRLDVPLSYVATNVSIPPIAPFLWLASIQIGERVLTGRFAALNVETARVLVRAPGPLLVALLVGSLVLGGVLGMLGGSLAYLIARRPTAGKRGELRRHP
jgi:uncharacterized protein (DUF2062 family)